MYFHGLKMPLILPFHLFGSVPCSVGRLGCLVCADCLCGIEVVESNFSAELRLVVLFQKTPRSLRPTRRGGKVSN